MQRLCLVSAQRCSNLIHSKNNLQTIFYSTHQLHAEKVTISTLYQKYKQNIPITMVTATDFHNAQVLDQCKIDIILVGDSMAMTALGHDTTLPLTVDQLIYHCQAVKRANEYSFLVGDMPFGSYEISTEQAMQNCIRVIKESGMNGVKLEGGARVAKQVNKIAECGIPVFCHIGLTPQSINSLGGFKVQGKTIANAEQLLQDAKVLQNAGASFLILECIPEEISRVITDSIQIPTIGIGAGVHVNGQVLVFHDLLGMYQKFTPKFCKQYAQLNPIMKQAIQQFKLEVETRQFPTPQYTYKAKSEMVSQFYTKIGYEPNSTNVKSQGIQFKELNKSVVGICGAGAIGTALATLFSQQQNVVLMESKWQSVISQIQQKGIQLTTNEKQNTIVHSRDVQIISTSEAKNVLSNEMIQQMNWLILCCKGYQLKEYLSIIQHIATTNPNCSILILSNGLGHKELLEQSIGKTNTIVQGTCYFGAKVQPSSSIMNPLSVSILGNNTQLFIPPSSTTISDLQHIVTSTNLLTIDSNSEISVEQLVWQKVIVNCVINPLTYLLECSNGTLLELYQTNANQLQSLVDKLIEEVLQLCKTEGIALQQWDRQFYLKKILDTCQDTCNNRSSMLSDLDKRSNETEIDNLNGYILQMASHKKISLPTHQSIVALVKSKSSLVNTSTTK